MASAPDLFNINCPSRDMLEMVGSKWAVLILCTLKSGPVRTGKLRRAVAGISQKMLTQTLRDLERNGIIERIDFNTVPPRVEYRLTKVGQSISILIKGIERWVVANYPALLAARTKFDRSAG